MVKGYENRHYFGPAANDNTSLHWYEKYSPFIARWLELGSKEGIELVMEGDRFNLEGLFTPHIKTIMT